MRPFASATMSAAKELCETGVPRASYSRSTDLPSSEVSQRRPNGNVARPLQRGIGAHSAGIRRHRAMAAPPWRERTALVESIALRLWKEMIAPRKASPRISRSWRWAGSAAAGCFPTPILTSSSSTQTAKSKKAYKDPVRRFLARTLGPAHEAESRHAPAFGVRPLRSR